MINISDFYNCLIAEGVDFFTGVPDSYLNEFCKYVLEKCPDNNVIAANEGNAIAIAAGHYLATGNIPLVYMQNSGLGNAINPLLSMCDTTVYGIPLLLLIGWRGEPGSGDWAQHEKQGILTTIFLDEMGIPYKIITPNDSADSAIKDLLLKARNDKKVVALIVCKGVFSGKKKNNIGENYELSRKEAIETILNTLPEDTFYAATTGRVTRELFHLREARKEIKSRDFLNVGAMGHTSSIVLGMAMAKPDKSFVVLDGDAAAIMHMGSLTMASKYKLPNYLHIVLNNGAHESVGGQPSAGFMIDFSRIAEMCGYKTIGHAVSSKEDLIRACKILMSRDCAGFIEVRIHTGIEGALPSLKLSHKEALNELVMELSK